MITALSAVKFGKIDPEFVKKMRQRHPGKVILGVCNLGMRSNTVYKLDFEDDGDRLTFQHIGDLPKEGTTKIIPINDSPTYPIRDYAQSSIPSGRLYIQNSKNGHSTSFKHVPYNTQVKPNALHNVVRNLRKYLQPKLQLPVS